MAPSQLLLWCLLSAHPLAAAIRVAPCDGDAFETWTFATGALHQLSNSGQCLSTLTCAPAAGGPVGMVNCSSTMCPGGADMLWRLDASGTLISGSAPSLCLTLSAGDGPDVNLWGCSGAQANAHWTWNGPPTSGTGTLTTQDAAVRGYCLQSSGGPGGIAVLNASALGRSNYGIGGLAAIGGARLIYEYVEPVRTQILDLLFNPTGGTFFQILKTEIEGDMDSSYGSGPSYQHNRGETPSFNRGIYLPWLLGEAIRRNPAIGTYSLAWGMPGWVGNGNYLSSESIQYHVDYMTGVRKAYNLTFELTGIHNERNWGVNWTIALRTALDAAGLSATRISVGDGSNSGCTDCPAGDDSITTALKNNAAFAAAVDVIGLHSTPKLPSSYDWEAAGKSYINSESNEIDGAFFTPDGSIPQWAPNGGSSLGPALSWPRQFLLNYINNRITGTIICPLSHAWTWAYGRHNHGTALFIEPWSGYYVLGGAFWTQAHFTQAAPRGWHFLDGSASGSWSGGAGRGSDWLVYGTLVSPSLSDVSVIAVNTDTAASAPLSFEFVGALAATFSGKALAVWVSNPSQLFVQETDVLVGVNGSFTFLLPPRSVATITSLRTLSKASPPIPSRAPFPLPYANGFEGQRVEEPGRLLSDLFGAFYVGVDPLGQRGAVLKQAVSAKPNAWLGGDGIPFTSLPGPGTAFANGNVSVNVLLTTADLPPSGGPAAVFLCGRVPIWQPANFHSAVTVLGVCLILNATGSWSLVDSALSGGAVTLSSGKLPAGSTLGAWHALVLAFEDDTVSAWIDGGTVVHAHAGLRPSSGVYGIATQWHTAWFDDLRLDGGITHGRTPGSYVFDVLPGELRVNNITGWAGFVLDLSAPGSEAMRVTSLGRFRVAGNTGVHGLDVIDAVTGASVLPGGTPVSVDLSPAGCPSSDLLGYCYAPAIAGGGVTLPPGHVYYVVSSETAGGDRHIHMTDPAAATTHAHRDGTSMVSYMGPHKGTISGSVVKASGAAGWTVEPNLDCMRGPLNMIVAGA